MLAVMTAEQNPARTELQRRKRLCRALPSRTPIGVSRQGLPLEQESGHIYRSAGSMPMA